MSTSLCDCLAKVTLIELYYYVNPVIALALFSTSAVSCTTMHDLEEMTFDQATMREHLARCFSRQKLTPFPHSQKNAGILYPRYLYQHIEVFCNCEMPECLDNMIQCDGCEEYYMVPHELCWTRNPPSRN